jgi:hypothetical protein
MRSIEGTIRLANAARTVADAGSPPGALRGDKLSSTAGRHLLRSVRIFRGGMLLFYATYRLREASFMEMRPPAVAAVRDSQQ